MVIGASLSFKREYTHVAAHQDNHTRWEDLTRATQLNLACDAGAKAILQQEAPSQIDLHVHRWQEDDFGHEGSYLGRQVTGSLFHQTSRIITDAFDKVDSPHVHQTLHKEVPGLFQVWAWN